METYFVQVDPEAKFFYLSTIKGWVKLYGHAISINNYQFSVIPLGSIFRISEIESGAKFVDIPVPDSIQSYEEVMNYLETVIGVNLVDLIRKVNEKDSNRLEKEIERMRLQAVQLHGQKPHTEQAEVLFN